MDELILLRHRKRIRFEQSNTPCFPIAKVCSEQERNKRPYNFLCGRPSSPVTPKRKYDQIHAAGPKNLSIQILVAATEYHGYKDSCDDCNINMAHSSIPFNSPLRNNHSLSAGCPLIEPIHVSELMRLQVNPLSSQNLRHLHMSMDHAYDLSCIVLQAFPMFRARRKHDQQSPQTINKFRRRSGHQGRCLAIHVYALICNQGKLLASWVDILLHFQVLAWIFLRLLPTPHSSPRAKRQKDPRTKNYMRQFVLQVFFLWVLASDITRSHRRRQRQ